MAWLFVNYAAFLLEGRMDFSDALKTVKAGQRITRDGWNGKDMWLSMTPGSKISADKFWSEANKQYALDSGGEAEVLPYLTMKTADGKIVPWLASHSDILAEDWKVYIPSATALPSGGVRHVQDPGPARLAAKPGVVEAAAATAERATAKSASGGQLAASRARATRARSAAAVKAKST